MAEGNFLQRVSTWPSATKTYIGELNMEMRRVTWPSWKQVRATTVVVIITVFLFAAYFRVVDLAVAAVLNRVFSALGSR